MWEGRSIGTSGGDEERPTQQRRLYRWIPNNFRAAYCDVARTSKRVQRVAKDGETLQSAWFGKESSDSELDTTSPETLQGALSLTPASPRGLRLHEV